MAFFCSYAFSSAGAASWPRAERFRGGGVPDILGLLFRLGDGDFLLRVPDLLRRLEDADLLRRWAGLLARRGDGDPLLRGGGVLERCTPRCCPSALPGCSCESTVATMFDTILGVAVGET